MKWGEKWRKEVSADINQKKKYESKIKRIQAHFCKIASKSLGNESALFFSYLMKLGLYETGTKQIFLDCVDKNGYSPLHLSSQILSKQNIEYFLSLGFDINQTTLSPPFSNIKNRNCFQIAILTQCKNNINNVNNLIEFLDYLESKGVDIHHLDYHSQNAFLLAIKANSSIEFLNYLIKKGINVNQVNDKGMNAILIALKMFRNYKRYNSSKLRIEFVNFLVNNGVSNLHKIDINNRNSISYSVACGDLKLIKYFENEKGVEIEKSNLLIDYINNTKEVEINFELLKYLFDKGVDFNSIDKEGNNFLLILIEKKFPQLTLENFSKLLQISNNKLNLNHQNNKGEDFFLLLLLKSNHFSLIHFIEKNYQLKCSGYLKNHYQILLKRFKEHLNSFNYEFISYFQNNGFYLSDTILCNLVQYFTLQTEKTSFLPSKDNTKNLFTNFKKTFDFCLQERRKFSPYHINFEQYIDYTWKIPLHCISHQIFIPLLWRLIKYLISLGSDLLRISGSRSILEILLPFETIIDLRRKLQLIDIAKYILIRSFESNLDRIEEEYEIDDEGDVESEDEYEDEFEGENGDEGEDNIGGNEIDNLFEKDDKENEEENELEVLLPHLPLKRILITDDDDEEEGRDFLPSFKSQKTFHLLNDNNDNDNDNDDNNGNVTGDSDEFVLDYDKNEENNDDNNGNVTGDSDEFVLDYDKNVNSDNKSYDSKEVINQHQDRNQPYYYPSSIILESKPKSKISLWKISMKKMINKTPPLLRPQVGFYPRYSINPNFVRNPFPIDWSRIDYNYQEFASEDIEQFFIRK